MTFRLKYKAQYGQKVVVVGSINELDKWKKEGPYQHELECRGDDLWESR